MRRPPRHVVATAPAGLFSALFSSALLLAGARGLPACAPAGDTSAASEADAAGAPESQGDASRPEGEGPFADAAVPVAPSGDAGAHDAILGTLHAVCPALTAQLASPTSSLVHDELVFAAGETYDPASLSPGGKVLYDTDNAGGSSTESEVMSFEVLHACEGATLVKTETEVLYSPPDDAGANSITDILVAIGGQKVGVSVTRAYRPKSSPLTDDMLRSLLEKKLEGINRSSERVLPADKWTKQILHVFAVDANAAAAVDRVWSTLSPDLRADTVALVTTTRGGGFIYCDPDPALGSECP